MLCKECFSRTEISLHNLTGMIPSTTIIRDNPDMDTKLLRAVQAPEKSTDDADGHLPDAMPLLEISCCYSRISAYE